MKNGDLSVSMTQPVHTRPNPVLSYPHLAMYYLNTSATLPIIPRLCTFLLLGESFGNMISVCGWADDGNDDELFRNSSYYNSD